MQKVYWSEIGSFLKDSRSEYSPLKGVRSSKSSFGNDIAMRRNGWEHKHFLTVNICVKHSAVFVVRLFRNYIAQLTKHS